MWNVREPIVRDTIPREFHLSSKKNGNAWPQLLRRCGIPFLGHWRGDEIRKIESLPRNPRICMKELHSEKMSGFNHIQNSYNLPSWHWQLSYQSYIPTWNHGRDWRRKRPAEEEKQLYRPCAIEYLAVSLWNTDKVKGSRVFVLWVVSDVSCSLLTFASPFQSRLMYIVKREVMVLRL